MTSAPRTCEDCAFFDSWKSDPWMGYCRRSAPVLAYESDGSELPRFPVVKADEYCGDFLSKHAGKYPFKLVTT